MWLEFERPRACCVTALTTLEQKKLNCGVVKVTDTDVKMYHGFFLRMLIVIALSCFFQCAGTYDSAWLSVRIHSFLVALNILPLQHTLHGHVKPHAGEKTAGGS